MFYVVTIDECKGRCINLCKVMCNINVCADLLSLEDEVPLIVFNAERFSIRREGCYYYIFFLYNLRDP